MKSQLSREDLVAGLRQLVISLGQSGHPVGIRIVGSAALKLAHFDRPSTVDIDAKIHPAAAAEPAIAEIAIANGWPPDWLNRAAEMFIPVVAATKDWIPIYDDSTVSIWVAAPPMLLAMKLRASRSGRDDDDIAKLLSICGVGTIEEADELYEDYYPGEVLQDKAYRMLTTIMSRELPVVRAPLPLPDLGQITHRPL
jgi:hypothetical protein